MNEIEIAKRAHALGPWYHSMWIVNGYRTVSYMGNTLDALWIAIRQVRQDITYTGKSVLDLGTMDGMWAFEAEAAGASPVVAGDIWQGSGTANPAWSWQRPGNGIERLLFAREALGSKIVPVLNAEVHDLHNRMVPVMSSLAITGFDIIQCLGLLYHVQNPLLALHQIRRCMKPGGIMLLETACWLSGSNTPVCRLNRSPELYPDLGTYWLPNLPCLHEMLKIAGLAITSQVCHVEQSATSTERVIMVCRTLPVLNDHDNVGSY